MKPAPFTRQPARGQTLGWTETSFDNVSRRNAKALALANDDDRLAAA
jgi:hypothetical protein